MGLKNYTSDTPSSRSISWIEDKLARHGARQILKEYTEGGRVASISFIMYVNEIELPFHLPARIAACEKILRGEVRRPRSNTFKRITEQAERTAWKILAGLGRCSDGNGGTLASRCPRSVPALSIRPPEETDVLSEPTRARISKGSACVLWFCGRERRSAWVRPKSLT